MPKTLVNIQIMRGVAALGVVCAHAATQFPQAATIPRIEAAQAGVDVFFVISGFIMVYITTHRPQGSIEFLLNRVHRIVPNYWFYTLLTAALAIAAPTLFRGTEFDPAHLLLSLLFIAHVNPAIHESTSPLLRVGWTLNYEMAFYLVFAGAIMFGRWRVAVTSFVIIVAVLIGYLFGPRGPVFHFYTRDIMLEFAFGMLLALFAQRWLTRVPQSSLLAAFLGGGAVAAIVACSQVTEDAAAARGLIIGLPALAIVCCCLLLPQATGKFVPPLFQRLGDSSYTLYLTHPFFLTALRVIATRAGLQPVTLTENIAFVVVGMFASAAAGWLAYRLIEVPLTNSAGLLFDRLPATIAGK